ncbi:MAG: tyrosine-type recombinase/integrase [Candidatus Acidiferrales bacterium]
MGVYIRKFRKSGRKIWWISYTASGRQIFESSHSTNRRFAEKLLSIRQAQVTEGRYDLPRSNPPTLESWCKDCIAAVPNLNTRRRYETSLNGIISFFGQAKVSQVSVERIESFKKARRLARVKSATINRDLFLLRWCLKQATRQRYIGKNPFDNVDFLEERLERRQPKILTLEEELNLLAECSPLLRALCVLLVETGLRIDREALVLKWTDLDLEEEIVTVHQTKTLAGRRTIPLSDFCTRELMIWKRLTGPEYSPFVFPAPSDSSKHLEGVRRSWTSALKKANILFFPIYNLRATFASRLSAAGVPDVFVGQLMGHSGGLLQTYSKALLEYRRDAIRKMEEFRQKQVHLETKPHDDLIIQ